MSQEGISSEICDGPRRRRARVACRPCRERKRRCNSRFPCNTCTQFDYCCQYDTPRARSRSVVRSSQRVTEEGPDKRPNHSNPAVSGNGTTGERIVAPPGPSPGRHPAMETLEANSGAAFVRRLGLNINPAKAPRLRLFAWNTGERLSEYAGRLGKPQSITMILAHKTMDRLAQTYFNKVATAYGFIDKDAFFTRMDERWAKGSAPDDYDQVLCGVAALGLHFTSPSPPPMELDLVESARVLVEKCAMETPIAIDTVTGWVLRAAYLRMTSTPHVTWMASCTVMHVAEAARIHQEDPDETVFDGSLEAVNIDIRRRLWGMAQHLNIWASFDLGRSNITLSGVSTKAVTPTNADCTSQLLGLIPLTEILDPNRSRSVEELETDLSRLLDEPYDNPPVIMAHINLVLCIFRRLQAQNPSSVHRHIDKILILSQKGLRAARNMVQEFLPWHHAANNPFQIVCLLLAMDTPSSMDLLHEALSVLELVRDTWNGPVLQEAYDTAYLLILFRQRRKEEDARDLRGILEMHANPLAEKNDGYDKFSRHESFPGTATENPWLDDLFAMPGWRDFNLEQFLAQDPIYLYDLDYQSNGL